MTKTLQQLIDYRVQTSFATSNDQGAYRRRSLTNFNMVAPPCSNETTKVHQTEER